MKTTVDYPGYHRCPGCQKPAIPTRLLACKPCWTRLPQPLQAAVTGTSRHSRAHRDAVTAAAAWYRENPATPTQGATS